MKLRTPSLKLKIVILVMLLFPSSIGVLTFIVASHLERNLTELLSAQQSSTAAYIADDINSNLQQRFRALTGSAAHVTPEMLVSPKKAGNYLESLGALNDLFKAGLLLIAEDGRGIADFPHIPERQNGRFEHMEYFRDATATGQPTIGKARIGRFTKLPGIAMAVPIKNSEGRVVALLVGFATLSDPTLFERLEQARLGESGYIDILDPRYRLTITSSSPGRILAPLPKPGTNILMDRFTSGFEGSGIIVNAEGVETLASAKRISSTGWIVGIHLPTEEAFAPIREMRWTTYRIGGALSILVILLTWFVIRNLFRTLDKTSASIRTMAEGWSNLKALPTSRDDEIGNLVSSFNLLVQQRQKIEGSLIESERRFRNTLEHAPIGMIIASIDGRIHQANHALCAMLGYDKPELEKLTIRDVSYPEDVSVSLTNMQSVLDGEVDDYSIERRYIRKDGQPIWGQATACLVRSDEGSPLYFIVQIQDITERKQFQETLQNSEERFKTVADFTYDWEYWRGLDKEFVYLSPSCERITGYSQVEFMADPGLIDNITHPADRVLMENHLADYQDDTEHLLDFRIIRKDGEVRWIAHGCRPVYGKNGAFLGRRVSNRDITERKQAEAALIEAKEQLALALEASSLSIWDFDISSGTVFLDTGWATLMGEPPGISVKSVDEVVKNIFPKDARRVIQAISDTMKGVTPVFQEELRYKTAAGTWKWIRCSGKVVERNTEGGAIRAIGTNLDIHERKTAEEKIRQLAYYDTLTELPNRRLLLDRIHQALFQARRYGRSLAIMFLDLDNFKTVNDTLGHEGGDELLKEVARRLAGCIRTGDTLSRQGGDEFVIVLAEIAKPADTKLVAQKILDTLRNPVQIANLELTATVSIGISIYPDDGTDDVNEMLKQADNAMYMAKNAGRNQYRFFGGVTPRPSAAASNGK